MVLEQRTHPRRDTPSRVLGRMLTRVVDRLRTPQPAQPVESVIRAGADSVVDCAVYVDGVRQRDRVDYAEAFVRARRRKGGFVWLGLFEPDAERIADVAAVFGVTGAALERVTAAERRPTLEQHGEITVLVLRTARYVEHAELTDTSDIVDTGDVTLLIGPQFAVSVRHGAAGALADVRADLERRRTLLAQGPWAVVHAVYDRMVELYLQVASHVEHDLEQLEQTAFDRNSRCDVQHIYQLKRELVEFKRAVLPLQQPLQRLTEPRSTLVPSTLRQPFRDVADRLARAVERVSGFNELLNSILQARLAQVGIDQNNDMRKIAAWAGIAALQTAIAGIYGMNFDQMPELHWKYGYPLILLVMAIGGTVLYRMFRRSGWL